MSKSQSLSPTKAIVLSNIGKKYSLYDNPKQRLKEALNPFRRKYHRDFWALSNLSFDVTKGETVGIIGNNGSGKSTLLQIITGTLTPTEGIVEVNGRVAALLELGAGFNLEFTGRENVYMNAAILGFSHEEMDARFELIADFADIGEFIDQPVKTYSSGMYVRLAFAVVINIDPEILIVDEALSVGDIRFQQKCFRKFREFQEAGSTILFVSHDTSTIINYCSRAIWLKDGQIVDLGYPDDICKKYVAHMAFDAETSSCEAGSEISSAGNNGNEGFKLWQDVGSCPSFGDRGAEIIAVTLCRKNESKRICVLEGGEKVIFQIKIRFNKDISDPIIGFFMNDSVGNKIIGLNNSILGTESRHFKKGEEIISAFEFVFPYIRNGYYSFSPAIAEGDQQVHIQHHWVHDAYIVEISSRDLAANMGNYLLVKDATFWLTGE